MTLRKWVSHPTNRTILNFGMPAVLTLEYLINRLILPSFLRVNSY